MKEKSKKYIVTGGAGFIGSHLVQKLLREGHKVVVVDNLYAGFESFIPNDPNVTFVNCDISSWDALSKRFSEFQHADGVFHLAACARIQPSIKDPNITNDYNVTGTLNVLQMMRMCNIDSIVYSASSSYYGNGATLPCHESAPPGCATPYSVTKYIGELYCQTWGLLWGIRNVVLRYFNVYGPRSPLKGQYAPVVSLFFRQALTGNSLTIVGDGEQRRDMTHVSDVASANIMSMSVLNSPDWHDATGNVLNVGTGTNYSINEVASKVLNSLGKAGLDVNAVNIPPRPGESRETLADVSRIKQVVGWEPTVSLDDGVKDLANYYMNNVEKLQSGRVDF